MWWLETRFLIWTDPISSYPKGGVAPLRHDLELARYLEQQRERLLSQDAIANSSAAAPREGMDHGIAFGIARLFSARS
jgi:hypothetical protein